MTAKSQRPQELLYPSVIKHGKYQKLPHWSPLSFKDDLFPAINLNSYGDFPYFPVCFPYVSSMIFPSFSWGISRLHGSSTHNGPWTQLQMALGHAHGHLAWKSVTWLYIYIMMLWICMFFNVLWCYGFVCLFNGFYDNFMIISWWLYVFLWDMCDMI